MLTGHRPQSVPIQFPYNVSMTTIHDRSLYDALMQRTSVRRYQQEPLPPDTLERIRELPASIEPLIPENDYRVVFRDKMRVDRDVVRAFGAYGIFVNPPHALIPYVAGSANPLVDWGYRTQQLMIALTRYGIASCYIGVVGRQHDVRQQLDLPANAQLGAILIFGNPLRSGGESPLHRNRLPLRDIFFLRSFDQPDDPPEDLLPIMKAAQAAPSAVNTQPWRFLWSEPILHLFIKRRNPGYLSRATQPYRYTDGGIVMANISLALRAAGMTPAWDLNAPAPPYPGSLEHIASIHLSG